MIFYSNFFDILQKKTIIQAAIGETSIRSCEQSKSTVKLYQANAGRILIEYYAGKRSMQVLHARGRLVYMV